MLTPQYLIPAYLILVNLLAFALYGIDKKKAKKKKYRISESTLLWMARIGGGIGCLVGMHLFHHKTNHKRFKIIVPVWTLIWLFGLIILTSALSW